MQALTYFTNLSHSPIYVGVTDRENEGDWRCVDGTPFIKVYSVTLPYQLNTGEPNNFPT